MGLRLGFRLAPHVYLSVPLGHGRRLAAHQGHADRLSFLLGLAIMWVFVRGAGARMVGLIFIAALAVLLARPRGSTP
jgi:hypothetical protein